MDELTYLSLFSGAGGGDLGMDAAGYRCVAQVEIDQHCQRVLRRHWPHVPKWSDVRDVRGDMLPAADVLVFGSPCQDLSVANATRAGLAGERSGLFHDAVRIINEQRTATDLRFPRAAIWENVCGALSSNRGADFADALRALAECGAHLIEWCVVDARHFVPQRRRRVFVCAVFDAAVAARCPEPLFPVGPRCSRHPQSGAASRENTAGSTAFGLADGGSIAGALGAGNDGGHRGDLDGAGAYVIADTEWMVPDVYPTIDASFGKQQSMNLQSAAAGHLLHTYVKRGRAQSDSDPESWSPGDELPTLNAFDNGSEGRATVLTFAMQPDSNGGEAPGALRIVETDVAPCIAASDGVKTSDRGLRIAYPTMLGMINMQGSKGNAVTNDGSESFTIAAMHGHDAHAVVLETAPTLTAGNDPSRSPQSSEVTAQEPAVYAASSLVRRLTPLECERLQGWPDHHTALADDDTPIADSHRYRMAGNGIAAPALQWVASHLAAALREPE